MGGGRWYGGALVAAALLLAAAPARADDVEQRFFSIQVDGKPAGEARMSITRQGDGREVVESRASVRVRFILTFTYTYQGTEVWQGGRLVHLQGSCNDNGKRFEVSADADADGPGLRLRVNGRERPARPDVWTSSYWKLPDRRYFNQPVTVLDMDRGQELARRLEYAGAEDLNVAGQAQKCYHFRVAGGPSPVDLWFDGHHRLVREDFVEMGHRTTVQLTGVRR
jgi:hypothetical protein